MAHPRKFSPATEAEIVRRYEAGESTCQLADAYGAWSARICKILKRHGVKMRSTKRYPKTERQQIAARYLAGESSCSIAEALGVKHPTIVNALKYEGVALRDRVEVMQSKAPHEHPNFVDGSRSGESFYKREAPKVLPDHCERCGSKDDLLVHHRNGKHNDNSPGNWERLCRICHAAHHKFWEERACA